MISDQIREWLDAHGVDGEPALDNCWHGIEYDGGLIAIIKACPAGLSLQPYDILRHAPLPDFGAMARELDELRAKVAKMDGAAREDSGSAFRVGQVWESPTRLTYRVVGIRPPERFHPAQISMRRGADAAGRLFVKRGGGTFGWRLVTP